MTAVAKRYARAAVESAPAEVEALLASLRALAQARGESPALRELLGNPSLRNQRQAVLGNVLAQLGLATSARHFVLVLSEQDRLNLLDEVIDEIEALADVRASRLRAHVTSAIALSEAQCERTSRALEKRFGKPVELEVHVEPEILGGLICQVGDTTLDSSVRHHLEQLRERLQG